MGIEEKVKQKGLEIGFSKVGICRVDPDEEINHLSDWLSRNFHGQMKYMENPKRISPRNVLADCNTIIVVLLNYRWPEDSAESQQAMISKYAWATDYHRVMLPMLEQLSDFLTAEVSGAAAKAYVDTGPISEKYWAQKAGVGWIGKHTNVISQQGSSWFFIGVLLTDLILEPDPPAIDHCGSCSECIQACPTRAIVAPYLLDSRLCISYLTIELRDSIPVELRPLIGNRIFGCDDCQDVCPWNRFAYAGDPRFNPKPEILGATLKDYLAMTPEQFRKRFEGTNVLRAKYRGFIRNCLVAAGNSQHADLIESVNHHAHSDDEMIREHAQWALERLITPQRH
jgi:epoxyqueuosine reductase